MRNYLLSLLTLLIISLIAVEKEKYILLNPKLTVEENIQLFCKNQEFELCKDYLIANRIQLSNLPPGKYQNLVCTIQTIPEFNDTRIDNISTSMAVISLIVCGIATVTTLFTQDSDDTGMIRKLSLGLAGVMTVAGALTYSILGIGKCIKNYNTTCPRSVKESMLSTLQKDV